MDPGRTAIAATPFLSWLAGAFGCDAPDAWLDPALLGGAFFGGTGVGAASASALAGTVLAFCSNFDEAAWRKNSRIIIGLVAATEASFALAFS